MSEQHIPPLRRRFLEDMRIKGLQPKTQTMYLRAMRERQGAPAGVRRDWLLRTGNEAWLAVPGPDGLPEYRAPQVRLSELLVGMTCEVDAE